MSSLLVCVVGCARTGVPEVRAVPKAAKAATREEGAPGEELPWAQFSAETFARAKAERKYVVMDGSAEWCHWCHVMEATTYHDAGIRRLLDAHFIAVKVDVDARPDLQERYADYGWPATVVFSPEGEELGAYRGYLDSDEFAEILNTVVASGVAQKAASPSAVETKRPIERQPLSEERLVAIQQRTDLALDELWDVEQGGWGRTQKAPLGWDNAWLLTKAAHGDASAKKKVLFALDQQAKLIDPVWGGIYQYSAAADWDHAHFEKLMTFQAPAIDNYATAYGLTRDPKYLTRARAMLGYVDRFMKGPEGGFFTTQDADLNAHDRDKPFMNGHDYYALGEKERLARGLPRIDNHEYGRENGLAIAAYCTMFEITKDANVLASAEKAARRVLETHRVPSGGITHDRIDESAPTKKILYLSDNASFGFALMRLYEVTKNADFLVRARAIADFMQTELAGDEGGGFFANTKDPDAAGILVRRRVPFEENVMATRMLARLVRALPASEAMPYRAMIDRTLRAISTPEQIADRGRMIGDYLLALEETKGVRGGPQAL
ncbi:thioredoxin domain-containing protein [Labilithrix luteola]|uniref:thioredoxin domain-containing protein n=1 Tax=Labilithrix luteola TaxID=1391654 RepID=UPI001475EAB1|nr:DUF255 domain-containing protein [Labilithrix luteola]